MSAINLVGVPGAVTTVSELGSIPTNTLKGYICTQVITKRGKRATAYIIGSYADFKKHLGGTRADDDSALLCKHALESGSKLIVIPAFHYTDIEDIDSVSGVKAVGTLANTPVSAVGAKTIFAIASWTGTGSSLVVSAPDLSNLSGPEVILANYSGTASQTPASAMTAVVSAINAGTGTHNYSASVVSGAIHLVGDPNVGASLNSKSISLTVTLGTVTPSLNPAFSGGVTAILSSSFDITAEEVGDGYNGTVLTIKEASNGSIDMCDIVITIPDTDFVFQLKNENRNQSTTELIQLNKKLKYLTIDSLPDDKLYLGTATLSTGEKDITDITSIDLIGSSVAKTGWYGFDSITMSMRIYNFISGDHSVNKALANYCERRTDMVGRGRLPIGLSIDSILDYRNGTGVYSYSPIDSWYFSLWASDVFVNAPYSNDVTDYVVSGLGYQAGNRSKTDSLAGEWISDSGDEYGKIKGANGVPLNLMSSGNSALADIIYESGVNFIGNDDVMKVVSWGNRTCLLDKSSLLSKLNIADLVVFVSREIKAISKRNNFKPNDIDMFNLLYRKARPFIVDKLVKGRAIEGKGQSNDGEGVWWHWLGDQFAKDLNDLKTNTKSDVDSGKYRVRFAFKPIASNEYIHIDLAPTDSTTILNVQILSTL